MKEIYKIKFKDLTLQMVDEEAREEMATKPTKKELEKMIKENSATLPEGYIEEDDGFYVMKDNLVYPLSHPDLSTQPSILPQRFGNIDIQEVLIPMWGKGVSEEYTVSEGLIPSKSIVLESTVFNSRQQMAACCSKKDSKWRIKGYEPNEVDQSNDWWALVRFACQRSDYYYYNDDEETKEKHYLEFVSLEDGNSFSFNSPWNTTISYSIDNGNSWNELATDGNQSIGLNSGEHILWKGNLSIDSEHYQGIGTFSSLKQYNAMGDPLSLINGDNFTEIYEAKEFCFSDLFEYNTNLVDASSIILKATKLEEKCYGNMFYGCTSLTTAPQLVATTLANYCYRSMFGGCTSLTEAPQLLATTLAEGCYNNMFNGCTSLTTAPQLLADTLENVCYCYMFSGCTNLNSITCLATDISATDCTTDWVKGVAATGTFTKAANMTSWTSGDNGIPSGWSVKTAKDLYFTSVAIDKTTFTFRIGAAVNTNDLQSISYSLDGGNTWVDTQNIDNSEVVVKTPTINQGGKVLWKGIGKQLANIYAISQFNSSGKYYLEGNIMSLLYGDNYNDKVSFESGSNRNYQNFLQDNRGLVSAKNLALPATVLADSCYQGMFVYCTNLEAAPHLPSTTLANSCYQNMFIGCTSLKDAPQLLATTLAERCYLNMFSGCTSLTTAPELLATTLAQYCYASMFNGCSSLKEAPQLPATTLAERCYLNMFSGCKSLTMTPQLLATTLADRCYQHMFYGCTSLTTAPELPSTTLANNCYYSMFYGCTSLTTAPQLPATTLKNNCYSYMFNGCTSLTEAPQLVATTLASGCYHAMFLGCTNLTTAPQLPATELAEDCYTNMFNGCTSLTEAPQLLATRLADNCYYGMFRDCESLTVAPQLLATKLMVHCYTSMFYGCTSLTTAPELPSTTLANNCYQSMFGRCISLTTAPQLPATTLAQWCYQGMFAECTSLTEAPQLPATELAEFCYANMFSSCSSLTTAPQLLATTLADNCYQYMFDGCSRLNSITCLATNISASNCTFNWVSGVASTGTFTKAANMTSWTSGDNGIPNGWTVQDAQ